MNNHKTGKVPFNYAGFFVLIGLALLGYWVYSTVSYYSEMPDPVFDLSVLKGKNIKQVNAALGDFIPIFNPLTEDYEGETPIFYSRHQKDGVELIISYNLATSKVLSITLVAQREYLGLKNIMRLGNLDPYNLDGF